MAERLFPGERELSLEHYPVGAVSEMGHTLPVLAPTRPGADTVLGSFHSLTPWLKPVCRSGSFVNFSAGQRRNQRLGMTAEFQFLRLPPRHQNFIIVETGHDVLCPCSFQA